MKDISGSFGNGKVKLHYVLFISIKKKSFTKFNGCNLASQLPDCSSFLTFFFFFTVWFFSKPWMSGFSPCWSVYAGVQYCSTRELGGSTNKGVLDWPPPIHIFMDLLRDTNPQAESRGNLVFWGCFGVNPSLWCPECFKAQWKRISRVCLNWCFDCKNVVSIVLTHLGFAFIDRENKTFNCNADGLQDL